MLQRDGSSRERFVSAVLWAGTAAGASPKLKKRGIALLANSPEMVRIVAAIFAPELLAPDYQRDPVFLNAPLALRAAPASPTQDDGSQKRVDAATRSQRFLGGPVLGGHQFIDDEPSVQFLKSTVQISERILRHTLPQQGMSDVALRDTFRRPLEDLDDAEMKFFRSLRVRCNSRGQSPLFVPQRK